MGSVAAMGLKKEEFSSQEQMRKFKGEEMVAMPQFDDNGLGQEYDDELNDAEIFDEEQTPTQI